MKHENETHNFLSKTIYFGHNNKNGSVQLHSVLDSLRGRRWKGKGNLGARESVRPPSRLLSRPNSLPLPYWTPATQAKFSKAIITRNTSSDKDFPA